MRIVIANFEAVIMGGVETYLQDLIPALRGAGLEIGVLVERVAAVNRPTIIDEIAGQQHWVIEERGLEATLDDVRKWHPDVVYQNGFLDVTAEASLAQEFPSVLFAHSYYGTCVSGAKMFSFPTSQACTRTLGLGCFACYWTRRCGGLNPITAWQQFQLQSRRRALFGSYRRILVASTHMRREYLRHGVAADRVEVLPLFPTGIAPDAVPPRAPCSGRVLFVGRLSRTKGVDLLIQAIPHAERGLDRSLKLIIVGDGAERAKLESLARRCSVDTTFMGFLTAEDRTVQMRQADILAVPSIWPEPFGLVGIEGGCVGLPAVGFALGGIPDWLIPGETGEIAPANPPTAPGLGDALVRALGDPAHHARLRTGAWQASQRFTLNKHVQELSRVFREAVAGPQA